MALKRIFAGLLAFVLAVSACGCVQQQEEPAYSDLGTSVEVPEIDGETDIHIRDKDLLYSMYDNTEIVTMYLTVYTGNAAEGTNHTWEEVNTYSAYDYDAWGVDRYKVSGLLQVGDENGLIPGELGYGQLSPNCTVQIRGQTSSRNAQKNYKISIKDNKGEWRGQTTIALNKHQADGLRFRNKMAFDLLSGIDELMSLRTTFVHLYVKDTTKGGEARFEDYGIYTQVEQLNKTALKTHGLDNGGHLYKINSCEFYRYEDVIMLNDDPNYDVKAFEKILEIKGNDDHSKLIAMLEMVNDYSIPIEDILENHFDMENIAYWMAFNILVGNMDTQNRNFYLYSPQNVDRWYILPWDYDLMLKETERKIKARLDFLEWESGVSNYWGNILFQRCLKSEVFLAALDDAILEIKEYLSEDRVGSYVDTYSKLLKPYVYSGRDAIHATLAYNEYDYICENICGEIERNYNRYLESLEKPLPFYIGVPVKTDNGYVVEWDNAYDFDGEDITYTFELATDYNFWDVLVEYTDRVITVAELPELPQGQYFIRVIATNESGESQCAFDCYPIELGKIYGTKCFYIDADGQVVEDVYVE